MADFGFQQFGKVLVFVGITITAIGILIMLSAHIGLFRLPGDIELGGKNWKFYFPIATSIILSLILTLLFWLINFFRR